MTKLLETARAALLANLALALLCCGAYPLLVWGAGQALFPRQAQGSLIQGKDGVWGSSLIAQEFKGAGYFHPRPSAAGNGYDAMNSGGSNLGPMSQKLYDSVTITAKAYREENGLPPEAAVPADAVTCSGSGLDPEITPANAQIQAPRVAKARGMSLEAMQAKVAAHSKGRALGFMGEPTVNVVELNADLDGLNP
jgi:K+-transporting ATPase ATPase C chain